VWARSRLDVRALGRALRSLARWAVAAVALLVPADGLAVEPSREAPVVVGSERISRTALERSARAIQEIPADAAMSRESAVESLVHEAQVRGELRRRGRSVPKDPDRAERALARLIAGRGAPVKGFLKRFGAFEQRWRGATKCASGWNAAAVCRGGVPECVWAGAVDVCPVRDPTPPEKPFWRIAVWPPRFGESEEDSLRLERRIRTRLSKIRGLRERLGEISNEGEITVFALDDGAAEIVARELYLLAR
jgi:hypothetical protein